MAMNCPSSMTACLFFPLLATSTMAKEATLSKADQNVLLQLSRQAMYERLTKNAVIQLDAKAAPAGIKKRSACLVILRHRRRDIRGISGAFDANRSLYRNVIDASVAVTNASIGRMLTLKPNIMDDSKIEIHVINQPKDLKASSPDELIQKLRPQVDGAILYTRHGSSILSPREWSHYPKPEEFMDHLCIRQNAPIDTWKTDFKNIRIQTFQGTWFREKGYRLKPKKVRGTTSKKLPAIQSTKTHQPTLHPALTKTNPNGYTIRFANQGDSEITKLKLHESGGTGTISRETLAPGEVSKWQVLSKDRSGSSLTGEYTYHGFKRTIHIPVAPGIATIAFNRDSFYTVLDTKKDLPLYPLPKQISLSDGWCDVSGLTINIPAGSNEKATAIAETIAARLTKHLKLSKSPAIKQAGGKPEGLYVLSLGKSENAWVTALPEARKIFAQAHETLRDQAFHIHILPKGVVVVAKGSWGLAYASLSIIQIAKGMSQGSKLPCLKINDWPDMEFRNAMTSNPGLPPDKLHRVAKTGWEGRFHQMRWARAWLYECRPELGLGKRNRFPKKQFKELYDKVRGMGIDPAGGDHLGALNWKDNRPYCYMVGETYYWAMKEVIDENLETLRPKLYNFGFSENQFAMRGYYYPQRQLEPLRDTMAEFARYLRRKGVQAEWESDCLMMSGGSRAELFNWTFGEKFPEGYYDYSSTFPSDLVWGPWYYWCRKPEQVLDGQGHLREQAKTGHPVVMLAIGDNVRHHVTSVLELKEKYPNVQGICSSWFGGTSNYCHPASIIKDAGPFWNVENAEKPVDFKYEEEAATNWECLLDADAPASVEEALIRLKDKSWRVWLHAREQLVAAGLPAVPVLLSAMSKANGEYRDRIEGCLSRNARDARNGRVRGKFSPAEVTPFLEDKTKEVRDMAAELLASASPSDRSKLKKGITDKVVGTSCIRALRIVGEKSVATNLIEVLTDQSHPADVRTEAAKTLGAFRTKGSVSALRNVMNTTKEKELRKAALWSLVLLKCREADKEIAAFLEHPDQDTRYRAAIGLVTLESKEVKRLLPWLLKDRHSLEIAAWSMFMIWDWKEAAAEIEKLNPPKDPLSRKRLVQLMGEFSGKGKKIRVKDHWH